MFSFYIWLYIIDAEYIYKIEYLFIYLLSKTTYELIIVNRIIHLYIYKEIRLKMNNITDEKILIALRENWISVLRNKNKYNTHLYIIFMFKQPYGSGDMLYTMISLHNARYTHIDRELGWKVFLKVYRFVYSMRMQTMHVLRW